MTERRKAPNGACCDDRRMSDDFSFGPIAIHLMFAPAMARPVPWEKPPLPAPSLIVPLLRRAARRGDTRCIWRKLGVTPAAPVC